MSENEQVQVKSKHKGWALAAVCFGLFMALLDVTVVNVAMPQIQSDLHASFSNIEWVISAYTLTFAVVLVSVSRLGDIFGRKTVFIWGLAVFTIGSL
ncbi:MFS transporter [Heyndrickxia ginsengihumi]